MEEGKVSESHLTSAAAFVEGGILDACDDACSICLEEFVESDPLTVTNCKHEFHLQCVLEWCQRSSKCPMCWQPISLKDRGSQELLDAVEHERTIRMNPPRNTTKFHHPTLGDFELQHLPVSANESELEECIIQHLAAAAAMGRARHIARREGQRALSDQADRVSASASGSSPVGNQCGMLNNRQHRAGPSDFQTLSESLKSRFSAMSMRYKESITKSTRGWKERWFSPNSSTQDLGSEVRRESSAGIANVTDLMEHQETRENRRNEIVSVSNCHQNSLSSGETKEQLAEVAGNLSVTEDSVQAPCAADSASH